MSSNIEGESSTNDLKGWWNVLWKTQLPSKIKLFIWKAYHDCLPTNYCLWKQKLLTTPCCSMCKSEIETIDHALCGCNRAKLICDSLFTRIDNHISVSNNFADCIIFLAANLTTSEFEKACIAFWSIWNNQNSIREGKPIADWYQ